MAAGKARSRWQDTAAESVALQFLDRAAPVILEHRVLTPENRARLAQIARDVGLSERQLELEIQLLCQRGVLVAMPTQRPTPVAMPSHDIPIPRQDVQLVEPLPLPPPLVTDVTPSDFMPAVVSPPPPADPPPLPATPFTLSPPTPVNPADAFRAYLRESLGSLSTRIVSNAFEQRVRRVGRKEFCLSTVYTDHLIREIAAELDMRVLSYETDSREESVGGTAGAIDGRTRAFVDRAQELLAQHRGLNPRSRMLLHAVAREQGLSDDEFEALLRELAEGKHAFASGGKEDELQQRLESFRSHLEAALLELPRRILTPRLVQHLAQAGVEREGLPDEVVQATIRELATAADVRIVSEDETGRHIEWLVDQALQSRSYLTSEALQRIHDEALQWGLTPAVTESIVNQRVSRRRARQATRRRVFAMIPLLVALLAVVSGVGWLTARKYFRRNERAASAPFGSEESPEAPRDSAGSGTAPGESIELVTNEGDGWWSSAMRVAVANALVVEKWSTDLNRLRARDAVARGIAYGRLTQFAGESTSEAQRENLRELLAHAYASDPSEEAAGKLRESLLGVIPSVPTELAAARLPMAFWSARTASASCRLAPPERAARLIAAFNEKLGARIGADPAKDQDRQVHAALVAQLYRLTARLAGEAPDRVPTLVAMLVSESTNLDRDERARIEGEFLATALPSMGQNWGEYRDMLRRAFATEDRALLLRFVDVYEDTRDEELQEVLRGLLRARTGVASETSRDELPRAFRAALGLRGGMDTRGRRRSWSAMCQEALSAMPAKPGDDIALLEETLRFARLSTMGIALGVEPADGEFDALVAAEVTPLAQVGVAARRKPPPITSRPLEDAIQQLTKGGKVQQRIQAIHRVVDALGGGGEATPDGATRLMTYLLRPKSEQEQLLASQLLDKVSHWRYLRLAAADELLRANPETFPTWILTSLSLEDAPRDDPATWRKALRAKLLASVLDALQGPSEADETTQPLDEASQQLFACYATQARLLGVAADLIPAEGTPSCVLKQIIAHQAARHAEATDAELRRYLERLPHEAAALEYVAENDLAYTVALQRLWARLLAGLGRKTAATTMMEETVAELAKRDGVSRNWLAQLRDGERASLELRFRLLGEQP